MNSVKSVWVLVVVFVLASSVWGVWQVLRIEPLAPMTPPAIDVPDKAPADTDDASTSTLEDPGDDLSDTVLVDEARTEAVEPEVPDSDVAESAGSSGPSSELRAILVDANTREPLPEFLLKLQDSSGRRVEVTTDKQGHFVTSVPLAHGAIEVVPVDHPKRTARTTPITCRHPAPEGRELQIDVESGPTYRLAIEPATIPAADLEARLRITGKDVRGGQDYDPVRDGPPTWVRFSPASGEGIEARSVEVRSRDGLWSGRVQVGRAFGIAPGIARVILEKRAVCSGLVVAPDGKPIQDAKVSLTTVVGETVGNVRSTVTLADGAWRFDYLPAGEALLAVSAFRYEPQKEVRIVFVPGEATQKTITLARLPPAGAIRGRVTSESGRYETPSEVLLTSIENDGSGSPPQHAQILWSETSQMRIGTFEFPDLPMGKYRIAGRTLGSWYEIAPEWKPDSLFVSPPAGDLAFLVLDNTARADLVLRVRDVDGGADVERFRVWFEIGKKSGRSRDLDSGEVAISGFPYEQTLRWRVDKFGYQPVIGDAASFGLEESHDGRVQRIAEVALVRGWGELFCVTEGDGKRPIAGARIVLDGREAGITDELGLALVLANATPREVRVEHADWNVRGRIDLSPAVRRKYQYFNPVRMTSSRRKR